MKALIRPLAILGLLATLGLVGLACDDGGRDVVVIDHGGGGIASIENQSHDAIVVEPFGDYLLPGEAIDYDLGWDIVHVVVVRDFDGLVLLETNLAAGDVWIIQ
ncbi:MAG: hypothetical protein JW889_11155 [Verrucomicrobia bacterium]|nr:hypothetical protein [Verrucomicrobiota bacterium]